MPRQLPRLLQNRQLSEELHAARQQLLEVQHEQRVSDGVAAVPFSSASATPASRRIE